MQTYRNIRTSLGNLIKGFINIIYPYENTQDCKAADTSNKVWALIPSYKPQSTTVDLINNLLEYNKKLNVLVIDDATPVGSKKVINKIKKMAKSEPRLHFIRNKVNKLKAGSLNYGIKYLNDLKTPPKFVIATDDDSYIVPDTIDKLLAALLKHPSYGAVCSAATVKNKNVNLITRLQGLEYHNFNISRAMDEGFFKGPLVMHGMLSMFRFEALNAIGGFTENHLIEDYDVTAKLKTIGWNVGFVENARASSDAPTTFSNLWKQRVRWYYGGLSVLATYLRNPIVIIQDVFGHFTLLTSYILIAVSYFLGRYTETNNDWIFILIILAVANFVLPTLFSIYSLRYYKDKDWVDILIRVSIIPEFIYANVLSAVLLGAYIYFIYIRVIRIYLRKNNTGVTITAKLDRLFGHIGYSLGWGTR